MIWQPTLEGPTLRATPLREEEFDELFAAASDPEIWAMHPERDRWTRPKFGVYFDGAIRSGGALIVRSREGGAVLGSSRYYDHDPARRKIDIGYTFLVRTAWGTGANRELKRLMLDHAFEQVDVVEFVVGAANLRSRRAMEKLGARLVRELSAKDRVVYAIERVTWSPPTRQC